MKIKDKLEALVEERIKKIQESAYGIAALLTRKYYVQSNTKKMER